MKALKKKKQPTFSIPCFKMCELFSFGVIQQSDFFFFNRKKRKEMSDLSVMKVMTCFSPRWDFHAPVRAAAGGVMFSGYPSICPVLTIVISPEEFQIWPNSSLRLEKNQWNFNSTFYIQRGHRSATSWCHNVAKTINSSDHYSPS